jgi:PPK2 family polyphosphate:nucleotide phosphotransferase
MDAFCFHSRKVRSLKDWDPEEVGDFKNKDNAKELAQRELQATVRKLRKYQERLYAEQSQALLVILQAMDTGGKDSTIRHVFSEINPQGCRVFSFKKPTPLELSHHFLWRIFQKVPPRGFIGIFNRSQYEDVLVTRVHHNITDRIAKQRMEEIVDFERSLVNSGTQVVKFFLNISKDEQRRRLQDRLDRPEKHWKFNPADLKERRHWNQYQKYYFAALKATSTPLAPWYVIPGNKKWFRNLIVAKVLHQTLKKMKPRFPKMPKGFNPKKVKIK